MKFLKSVFSLLTVHAFHFPYSSALLTKPYNMSYCCVLEMVLDSIQVAEK
ncbi:hypothetical protein D1BOALGB6SA_1499 [Olavius sp. associated proteobacterium Delta 1]|nr:hypothetical protein D1BOALGB6SA_1499 [Olavius sp. associated proteobacterium Delta 1]